MLKSLETCWEEAFTIYYKANLETAILQSYRPVIEDLEIYQPASGITNNPAESANATFKRTVNPLHNQNKKPGYFQVSHCFYFHQVNRLIEIMKGALKNIGNFQPVLIPTPSNLYLPSTESLQDYLDPNLVSDVVLKGKLPANLFTCQPYTSVNLSVITTANGEAEWFIQNDRIQWMPKSGSFLVTGLHGKVYTVRIFF